jgi:hypothetical protein
MLTDRAFDLPQVPDVALTVGGYDIPVVERPGDALPDEPSASGDEHLRHNRLHR